MIQRLRPEKKRIHSNETSNNQIVGSESNICFYPILRPYKNGLLVKSGRWTNTQSLSPKQKDLHQVQDYKTITTRAQSILNNRSASLETLEELDSSASDEQPCSPVSDDDLEELALLSQTWWDSDFCTSKDFALNNYNASIQSKFLSGSHATTNVTRRGRYGFQKHNLKLSPVEEPSEEYVDTMDELQCLVETVSEYLAEKEEEMNTFGTLPKSPNVSDKLPLKQKGHDKPEENTEHLKQSSAETSNENCKIKLDSLPDLSGVKSTVHSLFSSLSEKVGSGAKHLTASVEKLVSSLPEKTDTLGATRGTVSKIVPSDIDRSSNVPSTLETQNKLDMKCSRNSFSMENSNRQNLQNSDLKILEDIRQHESSYTATVPSEQSEYSSEFQFSSQMSVVASVLDTLNPLVKFSEKETKEGGKMEGRQCVSELGHSNDSITFSALHGGKGKCLAKTTIENLDSSQINNNPSTLCSTLNMKAKQHYSCEDISGKADHIAGDTVTDILEIKCDLNIKNEANNIKAGESHIFEKEKVIDAGFFQPLTRSLSQLFLPTGDAGKNQSNSGLSRVHKSEDDLWKNNHGKDDQSFTLRGKIPFFNQIVSEKQQYKKEKKGFFPNLFKFASAENLFSNNQSNGVLSDGKSTTVHGGSHKETLANFSSDSQKSISLESLENTSREDKDMEFNDSFLKMTTNPCPESASNTLYTYSDDTFIKVHGDTGFVKQTTSSPNTSSSSNVHNIPLKSNAGERLGNVLHGSQEKISKPGLLSGLFNLSTSENTLNKEEPKYKDVYEGPKSSSSFFSGLLKLSPHNMSVKAQNNINSNCPGSLDSLDRNNANFIGKTPNNPAMSEKPDTLNMCKSVMQSSNKIDEPTHVLDYAPHVLLYDTSESKQRFDDYCQQPLVIADVIREQTIFWRCNAEPKETPLLDADTQTVFDQRKMFTETRSDLSFEWEYEMGDFPTNKDEAPSPEYYMLNLPSPNVDISDFWKSSGIVMNLCKKDNDNIVDWGTNCDVDQQSLHFSELYESFDQLETGLCESEAWIVSSLNESSTYSLMHDDCSSTFEEPLMDLSYSSACDVDIWTLIDQASLGLDGSSICSSDNQAYWEWVSLLEFGIWWPSDDGSCGYYMYCDDEYIYSLLTDPSGQYVYMCTPETFSYPEFWDYDLEFNTVPSCWIEDGTVFVCGFKVPLTEDERCWFPEEETSDNSVIPNPLDLSTALRSDHLMNMNLQIFSQMFEESVFSQREQPLDFSSCKLRKLRVDFRTEKENTMLPLDNHTTLDLRTHIKSPKSPVNEEVNTISRYARPKYAEKIQPAVFDINLFQSESESPELQDSSNNEPGCQSKSENAKTPIHKLASIFSTLGEFIGKSPASDVQRSVASPVTKTNAQPVMPECTRKASFSNGKMGWEEADVNYTEAKENSNPTPQNVMYYENKQNQNIDVTNNIDMEKQNLSRKCSQSSHMSYFTNRPSVNAVTNVTLACNVAESGERVEKGNRGPTTETPSSHEPEETFLKSAFKLFNLGESSSTKALPDRQQSSGFFDFFKTQTEHSVAGLSGVEQSNITTKPHEDKGTVSSVEHKASQEKKDLPGISSILGSLGELFKIDAGSGQTRDNSTIATSNEERTVLVSEEQERCKQLSNSFPAVPTATGKMRTLKKQATIREKGPSGRANVSSGGQITERETEEFIKVLHAPENKNYNGMERTEMNSFVNETREVPDYGPSTYPISRGSDTPSTHSFSKTNLSKHEYNIPVEEKSFQSPSRSSCKPPPKSQSIFSIFSVPDVAEPSPSSASNISDGKPSEVNELFKLPSFFSRSSPAAKSTVPHSNSNFSFFGLSLFSEKPQTTPENKDISEHTPVKTNSFVNSQFRISSPCADPKPPFVPTPGATVKQQVAAASKPSQADITNTCQVPSTQAFTGTESYVDSDNKELSHSSDSEELLTCSLSEPGELQTSREEKEYIESSLSNEPSLPQLNLISDVTQHSSLSDVKHIPTDLNHMHALFNPASAWDYHGAKEFPPGQMLRHTPINDVQPKKESASFFQMPGAPELPKPVQEPENEMSIFDSSTKMISNLMTKINIFSTSSSEAPKASSRFFSMPQTMTAPTVPQKDPLFSKASSAPIQNMAEDHFDKCKLSKENNQDEVCFAPAFHDQDIMKDDESTIVSKDECIELGESSSVSTTETPTNNYDFEKTKLVEECTAGEPIMGTVESELNDHNRQEALVLHDLDAFEQEAPLNYKRLAEKSEDVHTCQLNGDAKLGTEFGSHNIQITNVETNSTHCGHPKEQCYSRCSIGYENKAYNSIKLGENTVGSAKPLLDLPNMPSLSKFNFVSSSTNSGKSFGSLFSQPASPSGGTTAETGLLSSFKKLSASLFEMGNEEKTVKTDSSPVTVLGKKLESLLPWQKDNMDIHIPNSAVIPQISPNENVETSGEHAGCEPASFSDDSEGSVYPSDCIKSHSLPVEESLRESSNMGPSVQSSIEMRSAAHHESDGQTGTDPIVLHLPSPQLTHLPDDQSSHQDRFEKIGSDPESNSTALGPEVQSTAPISPDPLDFKRPVTVEA
ncbi:uncharacterized protein [Ambystoma mexicanum]|uniref:uncharacterized protein n=1 Tax=Ambystoma mexicanum TaxID=8296 RepID=UPI0037E7F561